MALTTFEQAVAGVVTGRTAQAARDVARITEVGKPDILAVGSEREAVEAAKTSKAALYNAKAGLCMKALRAFVKTLYELDGKPHPANVDATGLIHIGAPWSSRNCRKWGLARPEADAMRADLRARLDEVGPHLLLFDGLAGRWLLNVADFPTLGAAKVYIDKRPITWQSVLCYYRTERHRKAHAYRTKSAVSRGGQSNGAMKRRINGTRGSREP